MEPTLPISPELEQLLRSIANGIGYLIAAAMVILPLAQRYGSKAQTNAQAATPTPPPSSQPNNSDPNNSYALLLQQQVIARLDALKEDIHEQEGRYDMKLSGLKKDMSKGFQDMREMVDTHEIRLQNLERKANS